MKRHPCIIYLRKTQDWRKERHFKMPGYLKQFGEKPDELIRIWNKAFAIDYFEFRARLKEIAISNWRLPFITGPIEKLFHKLDDNQLILPVDDDDWFHPDLKEILQDKKEEFIYWEEIENFSTFVYTAGPRSRFLKHPGSNAYAVRVSFLKKLPRNELLGMLQNHSLSLDIANRHDASVSENLDFHYSCHNRHPASASSFWDIHDYLDIRKLLPRKFNPLPFQYKWMWEEQRQLFKLVESLRR